MGSKSSLMLQDEEIKQISNQTGFSPQQIEKLYSRFTQLDRANCGSLSKTDLLSIPELAINPLCDRLIEMFFSGADRDDERINFRQFTRVLAAFRCNQQQQQQQLDSDNCQQPEHSAESDEARSSSEEDGALRRPPVGAARRLHRHRQRASARSRSQPRPVGCIAAREAAPPPPPPPLNDCLTRRLYFVFKIYDNDNDGRISFNDLRSILKLMVGNYIEEVQLDKIATRAFVEVDQDNDGFIEFGEFCKVFAGKDMEDKLRVKFF